MQPKNTLESSPQNLRLENNYKRIKRMQGLRVRNFKYVGDIDRFRTEFVIDDQEANNWLDKYKKNALGCCSNAVALKNINDIANNLAVKSAMTCNHRFCNVCNALRAKKLRSKFFNFFQSLERNVFIKQKYCHFFPDLVHFSYLKKSEFKKIENSRELYKTGEDIAKGFNFMHLTLTVPHHNGTWQGKQYYAKELLECFNKMRKCNWWEALVFAGEQTIETTNTDNGLHIHIHALLLVKKDCKQSRNLLYGKIFSKWNELTIDYSRPSIDKEFSLSRRIGILESLDCIKNDSDLAKIYYKLDGRGSTMVGLRSIYKEITKIQFDELKKNKFERDGKYFKEVNGDNPKDLNKAVLECLKYHFEPAALEDENGTLDVPFLMKLLPNIYRQRLYSKFGAFNGISQLNVSENPIDETDDSTDLEDDFMENATVDGYCPKTGESCNNSELQFIIIDVVKVVFKKNKRNYYIAEKDIKDYLPLGFTTRSAMIEMINNVHHKPMFKPIKGRTTNDEVYLN